MRGDDARQHDAGSGEPRLIVLSQARWSRNDGGENCLFWAPVRRCVAMDGPRGHMRNTSSMSEETCRGGHGFPVLPNHLMAVPRQRPQQAPAAAANRARLRLDQVRGLRYEIGAAYGKLLRNARLPPRDVSSLLTSPMSRTLPGRFGRSPYFRHQRLQRRSLRPRGGTRRINSLYQCSLTVGTVPDRTCLWAPSLPVRDSVRATRCFSSGGVSNQPRAQVK